MIDTLRMDNLKCFRDERVTLGRLPRGFIDRRVDPIAPDEALRQEYNRHDRREAGQAQDDGDSAG